MARSVLILILLTAVSSVPSAMASDTNAAAQGAQTSSSTSTEWLLSYEGKRTNIVRWDPRFPKLLSAGLANVRVKWWDNHTLAETALEHLSGGDNPVYIELNRYVTLSAIVYQDGEEKGLLWVDTGASKPTMIFARLSEEPNNRNPAERPASVTLYVKDRKLAANLPSIFLFSLSRWVYSLEGITKITSFTLINSQGEVTQLSPDLLKTK